MDGETVGLLTAGLLGVARVLTAPLPFARTVSVAEALPLAFGVAGIAYVLANLRDGLDDLHFQERLARPVKVRIIVAKGNVRDERARLVTLSCILGIYLMAGSLPGRTPTGADAPLILLVASLAPVLAAVAVAALSLNSWRRRREREDVRTAAVAAEEESR